ncbi:uncharacterized protein LOC127847199 isoform X1 [Dreissena polymorpha]|uniref:NACHT domain-containing protein n=1 Tax=Dreissena polymorpha TaxID=45954 RepID=A0A9D4DJI2_DREPO|nr:uncharacterized protein LOC127847199 isoform X1 [Dreissena polymorpha]XP_052234896.1 uncharacterized protein LOC127847199 isoform X1 [Dreissena polymorpha]KAH3749670.1 hypothetical protein DPMN_184175 [Dreissena polymorpha]
MADLKEKIRDHKMVNLIKCILAGFVTRDALIPFVTNVMEDVKIYLRRQTKNVTCGICSTSNAIDCPAKGTCNIYQRKCSFHSKQKFKQCVNGVCQTVRNAIAQLHRHTNPSWCNTDATQWLTESWEVAKCFLPPKGYDDKDSADKTDINGIINLIINCRQFDNEIDDDLCKQENVCTMVREKMRDIRHASQTKVSDDVMHDVINALTNLLKDIRRSDSVPECINAIRKLNEIKQDNFDIKSQSIDVQQDVWKELVSLNVEDKVEYLYHHFSTKIQIMSTEIATLKDAPETKHARLTEDFQEDLKNFYIKFKNQLPIYPLPPRVKGMVEHLYVTPNVIRLDHGKFNRESQPHRHSFRKSYSADELHLSDILLYHGNIVNEVYIEGEPGVGKTAFCVKTALAWASKRVPTDPDRFFQSETLGQFKFVFLVFLRDFSGRECDIDKMIYHHILTNLPAKYTDQFLQRLLDEEVCLIILDGLDEWRHNNNSDCFCGAQTMIPRRRMRDKCVVLTTTRPWKMAFARMSSDIEIEHRFEITGVKDPRDLAEKVIQCLNNKTGRNVLPDDFFNSVEEHNLTHCLNVPVLNMQLLYLWYTGGKLGSSVCDIYKNMIDMLFGQLRMRLSSGSDMEQLRDDANDKTQDDLLEKLQKLAFDTLIDHERESSIVFDQSVVDKVLNSEEKKKSLQVGILTQRSFLQPNAQHGTVLSFLHKTFQEFLAARHIATSVSQTYNLEKSLANLDGHLLKIQDIATFFEFLCGIDSEKAVAFSASLMNFVSYDCEAKLNAIGTENSVQDLQNLHIIQQAQDLILKGLRESKSNQHEAHLYLTHVTDRHVKNTEVWRELVERNESRIVSVYLEDHNDKPTIDVFRSVFASSNDTLVYVTLKERRTAIDLSRCRHLKYLCIAGEKELAKTTASTESMITCSLERVSEWTEKVMFAALSKNSECLQNLHVHQCKHTNDLVNMLPELKNLKRLKICHVDFTKEPIERLSETLTYVYFELVTINVVTLDRLTKSYEGSSHSVTFKLKECHVVPQQEFISFKENISSSNKYNVMKDGYKMQAQNLHLDDVFDGMDEMYVFKYSLNPNTKLKPDDRKCTTLYDRTVSRV